MKMIKKLLLILLILFMFGCSSTIKEEEGNEIASVSYSKIEIPKEKQEDKSEIIVPTDNSLEIKKEEESQIEEQKINIDSSVLEIHFIDVGQGDSILVLCDGCSMLVDGGPSSASSLLYEYLKKKNVNNLDYVICTHPDEDHIGGVSGALNYATVSNVLSSCSKDTKEYDSLVKYTKLNDVEIQIPNTGDSFNIGSANVEIVSCNAGTDNDASIVMKITHGENSFLLTGDASASVEENLINSKANVDCDVLKVAHHGSNNSSSDQFLEYIEPKYAVISVGKDNTYEHPASTVLNKLKDMDIKTYRTDLQGDIICSSDGKSISFSVEKNKDIDTYKIIEHKVKQTANQLVTDTKQDDKVVKQNNAKTKQKQPETTQNIVSEDNYTYCINTNTKKFHYSYCSSVDDMKDKNKRFTNDDRDTIIAQGFVPCKRCNP